MPRILTTQTNYIVISAIDSRSYMHERYTDDLGRRQVIRDIADGQYEAVTQVIEFNVAANSCRDVTDEIIREAIAEREDSDPHHYARQRREARADQIRDDRMFARATALSELARMDGETM